MVLFLTAAGCFLGGVLLSWIYFRGSRIAIYRTLGLQRKTLVELGQMALAGDNMQLASGMAFRRGARAVGADAIVWLDCRDNKCRITSFSGSGLRSAEEWPVVAPIGDLLARPGMCELDVKGAEPASRAFYEQRGYAYCLGAHVLFGSGDSCLLVLYKKKPALSFLEREFVRAMAATLSYALQRNHYEEQLREVRQRQEAALESLEAGVWEVDLKSNVVSFDEIYAEQTGRQGAVQGVPMREFERIHPDDLLLAKTAYENHINGVSPRFISEHRIRLEDGTYEWFHSAGRVVERAKDGTPVRIIGSQVNIDARKRVEEMLHTVNYTLETLLRISPIAIVALKQDFTPVLWNPAADQVLGLSPRAPYVQDLLRWIGESPPLDGERKEITLPDGTPRILRIWSNAGQAAILVMALDVTEEATAAVEKQKLESLLVNRQKLEAIGSLASGVAHEINNPLTSVINFGQLILDRLPPEDSLRRFAEAIVKEGLRISSIVRDLLSFSRPDEDQDERFKIRPMLESVLGFLTQSLRKARCSVRLDVSDSITARGRLRQLQQVILNLVNNAAYSLNAKYPGYDAHKVIEIKAENISDEQGRWVRLTIKDFGLGIPADVLPRIFDPFFTTKPRDVGTGLGLSISYDIVRKHSGRLTAESVPGESALFTLDLPDE